MIDWDGPLQFVDGQPCKLFGTLNREGKCKFADGRDSEFSETWAEEHSHGLTRIIIADNNNRFGFNEDGAPVNPWDNECGLSYGTRRVMNVPPVSEESMAAMAEHEMWGMF